MARIIIQIKDKFFEYSTIFDAPVTYGMTMQELRNYIKEEYGNEGISILTGRLQRVAMRGTSAQSDLSLEETIYNNRAGENEICITEDEIYDRYKKLEEKETSCNQGK